MAIKKSVTTAALVTVNDAYHRVECVMHPTKNQLVFHVRSYAMKEVSAVEETITIPHDVFFSERIVSCDFQLGESDAWAQAYAHLKTLPEFADAVDC